MTIVPSPYQRDLFTALAARADVDLTVLYLEAASPDSPWPEQPLRPFERIMPGFWLPVGAARVHVNWGIAEMLDRDSLVILSSFTSMTGQWLMRRLKARRWAFWGERLRKNSGVREIVQSRLAAPLARASAIVGIGQAAEADYRQRFPRPQHFCIPYYCDLSAFFAVERRPRNNGPTTFLFCGQMIRRKGIDVLLAAFGGLLARGLDVELLLVGRKADLPELLARSSLSVRGRIRYVGFQAPEKLPAFFAQADVFVLPSRHDGWGVVVNQALAAGLPVITSDAVGAGLDLIDHGQNGLRVRAGDIEELCDAMEIFARDPVKAVECGVASRRKARGLVPEAGAEKWVHVFDKLNAKRLRGAT